MKTILDFVFANKYLIQSKNFLPLYNQLMEEYYITNNEEFNPGNLTRFFLDLNINPLDYTDNEVPIGCFYEYNFDDQDYILPSNITKINNSAYAYASGIKRFFAPKGFKEIGLFAFMECSNLKDIYLPSTLTDIPKGTFLNEGITDLTIHTPMNSVAWRYAEENHITRDNLYRYPGGTK